MCDPDVRCAAAATGAGSGGVTESAAAALGKPMETLLLVLLVLMVPGLLTYLRSDL
jgi:hypothetical protein